MDDEPLGYFSFPRNSSRLRDLALLMRLNLTSLGLVTALWLDITLLKAVCVFSGPTLGIPTMAFVAAFEPHDDRLEAGAEAVAPTRHPFPHCIH